VIDILTLQPTMNISQIFHFHRAFFDRKKSPNVQADIVFRGAELMETRRLRIDEFYDEGEQSNDICRSLGNHSGHDKFTDWHSLRGY
jgi:hypothetical protein